MIEFETGKVVGEHQGFWYYTIGQRQGIKLSGGPWYVVAKDPAKNIVFISKQYQDATESKSGVIVNSMNWISGIIPTKTDLYLKYRHGADIHPVSVEHKDGQWIIKLVQESTQGIATGQFAVLYDGEKCLGGGIIDQTF